MTDGCMDFWLDKSMLTYPTMEVGPKKGVEVLSQGFSKAKKTPSDTMGFDWWKTHFYLTWLRKIRKLFKSALLLQMTWVSVWPAFESIKVWHCLSAIIMCHFLQTLWNPLQHCRWSRLIFNILTTFWRFSPKLQILMYGSEMNVKIFKTLSTELI